MALVYPSGVVTDRDKWLCLMRTMELLRVAHNFIAQKMKDGARITPAYWNNLPKRFRVAVPANVNLSFSDWPSFVALFDDVRQQVIVALLALPRPAELTVGTTPQERGAAKTALKPTWMAMQPVDPEQL